MRILICAALIALLGGCADGYYGYHDRGYYRDGVGYTGHYGDHGYYDTYGRYHPLTGRYDGPAYPGY